MPGKEEEEDLIGHIIFICPDSVVTGDNMGRNIPYATIGVPVDVKNELKKYR